MITDMSIVNSESANSESGNKERRLYNTSQAFRALFLSTADSLVNLVPSFLVLTFY